MAISPGKAKAHRAAKTKTVDYPTRVVFLMDTETTTVFAQEWMNQHSLDMCAYCAPEILGTEGTGADIEVPPMTHAVKHPNILVVIAVADFGPALAG